MIELKHIEFAYESGSELLRNINMQVNDGEYIAIVGENGSGKSTLVKLLLGLLEPSKGELKNTFSSIGYVPQRFETLNSQFPITVYEVMEYYRRILKVADKQAVRRCLEQMHVYDLRDRLIGTLSGGQCQKVLIARALLGLIRPSTAACSSAPSAMMRMVVPPTMPRDRTPSRLFAFTRRSSFSTQMEDLNSLAFWMKKVAGRACRPT